MPRRVLVIDTSVLCCLLSVPGKDTCGSGVDRWDRARIEALLDDDQSIRVLPLATIIETGNHIAQSAGNRFDVASRLSELIEKTANGKSPWAAFTDQSDLWGADQLNALAESWPRMAASRFSIGDATIKQVAEFYAKAGYTVEIITGDAGLRAYQPTSIPLVPRRRR